MSFLGIVAEEVEVRQGQVKEGCDLLTAALDMDGVARAVVGQQRVELLAGQLRRGPGLDVGPLRVVLSRPGRPVVDAPQAADTQTPRQRADLAVANAPD